MQEYINSYPFYACVVCSVLIYSVFKLFNTVARAFVILRLKSNMQEAVSLALKDFVKQKAESKNNSGESK
jgi:hypothetical protein